MSFMWRSAFRAGAPLATALVTTHWTSTTTTRCDASNADPNNVTEASSTGTANEYEANFSLFGKEGMRQEEVGDFHGLFPRRQLWRPLVPYPLWFKNWDGHEPPSTGDKELDREQMRRIRKHGVTRHIILVRHGQYDESEKEDELRTLTPLGKEQAALTGQRLADMMAGAQEEFGPCNIRHLRVSNMTRAKETADIIATYLPNVQFEEPDPQLNEGRPCHHIPGVKASKRTIELTDENHPRIEAAFQKYFYRQPLDLADEERLSATSDGGRSDEKHEFEVIVCHANVIRYFLCRALQLPPEAWLRYCPFNCSLTYITIRATGSVSCRMVGDIGHLPYNKSTFSKHHGFNW
jgi:serine/threonine-protein phosphatase PGAM5